MSEILELEKITSYIIFNNDFSEVSPTKKISFSWGDQHELIQWIIAKDKENSGMRSFQQEVNPKYPLIWLVHPVEGRLTEDGNIFEQVKFIIASNTNAEWLNSTRERNTMPTLTKIANHFLNILATDKNASIVKKNGVRDVKFRKIYNYQEFSPEKYRSTENESAAVDPWDAITLQFDLIINNNCLKTLKLCQ